MVNITKFLEVHKNNPAPSEVDVREFESPRNQCMMLILLPCGVHHFNAKDLQCSRQF